MAGGLTTIPQLVEGASGQSIMDDIINVIVDRMNKIGGGGVGLLYSQTESFIIQTTTAERSLLDSGGAGGQYGNRLLDIAQLKEGTAFRIKIKGLIDNASGMNITLRVKMNATTLYTAVLNALPGGADNHFEIETIVTIQKEGAPGEMLVAGMALYSLGDDAAPNIVKMTDKNPIAVSTAIPQTIDLTAQLSAGTAGNLVRVLSSTIEKLTINI